MKIAVHLCLSLVFIVFFSGAAPSQPAGLQIIHNASGPGTGEGPAVDVYLNGQLRAELQGLSFRQATAFLEVTAGVPLVAGIALSPSSGVADTLLAINLGILPAGSKNVAVLYQVAAGAGYALRLALRTAADGSPGQVNLMAFHGTASVAAIDIHAFMGDSLFRGVKYGDFSDYEAVDPGEYFLEASPSGRQELLGTFQIDLSARAGQALVVFTSGLIGEEPLFNLFVASPDGQVEPMLPVALVQIIHNCPSPQLAITDLWVTDLGIRILNDFSFLEATPVAFFPTRLVFDFGFAPASSTGAGEVQYTIEDVSFADGRQYTVVAGGLPGDADFPLQLFMYDQARLSSATADQVAVNFFHGIPGAAAFDVELRDGETLAMELEYGQFSEYASQAAQAGVWVLKDAAAGTSLASFAGDLAPVKGFAATMFAGGLPGGEPAFGLYLALADGSVLALDPVTRVQIIHNAPAEAFDVYINGEKGVNDLVFRSATAYTDLPTREPLEITLTSWSAGSIADPVTSFDPLTLEDGKEYLLMVAGVAGSADQPLSLKVFDEAKLKTEDGQGVELVFFHGAPDAPSLDLSLGGESVLFGGVARGAFAPYAPAPATAQTLRVSPAGGDHSLLRDYTLDLRDLTGKTAVLYATGFLEEGAIAPFEIWIAYADGTARPLPQLTTAVDLKSLVGELSVWPNPARGSANLGFRLEEATDLELQILDLHGRQVRHYALGRLPAGDHRWRLDTGGLPGGLYLLVIRTPGSARATRLSVH